MKLQDIKTYVTVPPTGIGGSFWVIVKITTDDGIDTMTVRVEHPEHGAPDAVVAAVQNAVTSRIEVRIDVVVVEPNSFPKTEFKAKRIRDERDKS